MKMNPAITMKLCKTGVGLLMGLVTPLIAAAAEFHVTSITLNTNGVTVTWTNPVPGYAYTPQVLDSLSSGDWSNAPTRYRWPSVKTRWTEPGALQPGTRFYRAMAETIRTPARGKILSSNLVLALSLDSVKGYLGLWGLPTNQAVYALHFYRLDYETVDPFGLPITASGAVFVPQGVSNSLPLFSYQHGTRFLKTDVPSAGEVADVGLLFASSGYLTVLPDYLGMGDSPGFPPYVHAKTEATAVVDLLRAARTFCASNGIALNSQLFLAGYSQGGHATMAAEREIEMYHTNEFKTTACAPMAGPYDLSGTVLTIVNNPKYPFRGYFPNLVAAFLPVYGYADTLEELFRPPYDQTLAPLLDGTHDGAEIHFATPTNETSIFYPDYEAAFLTDPNHPLRLAIADNNLLDWTPRVPMHMYHCSGEDQVPYTNMAIAYQTFTSNGACCVQMIDPGEPQQLNHVDCRYPSIFSAKAWFDSLKE